MEKGQGPDTLEPPPLDVRLSMVPNVTKNALLHTFFLSLRSAYIQNRSAIAHVSVKSPTKNLSVS